VTTGKVYERKNKNYVLKVFNFVKKINFFKVMIKSSSIYSITTFFSETCHILIQKDVVFIIVQATTV